jgi:hypothetical protein
MLKTISYQWLEREKHSKGTGDGNAEASKAGKRLARIRVSFCDVELGKSYGLVHKLTGHGIIGGASKQTAPHIYSKNSKSQSKNGPRFTKKS